jgi:hypothetical protein
MDGRRLAPERSTGLPTTRACKGSDPTAYDAAGQVPITRLVLAIGRRSVHLTASVVAASALAAVTYRYVDVGSLGPVPDM